MLESKILPTILIILPSSVFLLLAHPGVGKAAAEKCNTRPSSSAPQGAHWYYRVNHTDNRRCWFLSSEGMKVRSNARGAMSDVASDSPTPKRDNSSETARATPPRTTSTQVASVPMIPEQATTADPAFSETPVREHAAAMDFAARWPDLSESPDLYASELAAISNSYAETQTAADVEERMPLTWPVTEAGRAGQQQDPASSGGLRIDISRRSASTGIAVPRRRSFQVSSPLPSTVSPRSLARGSGPAGPPAAYAR